MLEVIEPSMGDQIHLTTPTGCDYRRVTCHAAAAWHRTRSVPFSIYTSITAPEIDLEFEMLNNTQ